MAKFGIRVQLVLLLLLVAVAEFLVGDLGVLLHQMDLPEAAVGLAGRQPEFARLLANMLLVIAAIMLAVSLPALVRRRPGRSRALDEALVLLALVLIGALGLHALGRSGLALAVANLTLALMALIGALRILRGDELLALRLPAALMVTSVALPQLWRAALEFGGGEEGPLALAMRQAADHGIPATWALGALFLLGGNRRSTLVAVILGLAAGSTVLVAPAELRHLLATVTGLWFSSWSGIWLTLLLSLGVVGLASALLAPARLFLGLGLLLLACSGFRASGAGELLIQAIAIIMIGHWARGRGRDLDDLDGAIL